MNPRPWSCDAEALPAASTLNTTYVAVDSLHIKARKKAGVGAQDQDCEESEQTSL